MRCPICNHDTSDESDFCGNCGAKLSRYKRAEENTPVQEQQPTESPIRLRPLRKFDRTTRSLTIR
jgi:predicted amidophosphoribosyltransferase